MVRKKQNGCVDRDFKTGIVRQIITKCASRHKQRLFPYLSGRINFKKSLKKSLSCHISGSQRTLKLNS